MAYYIRYESATGPQAHGPFESLDEALGIMAAEVNWYLPRFGSIVEAVGRPDAKEAGPERILARADKFCSNPSPTRKTALRE